MKQELLGPDLVGRARAFFHEQARISRRSYQPMMRHDAVQSVQRRLTSEDRKLSTHFAFFRTVVAALFRQRATLTRLDSRRLSGIFAYGFHRMLFALRLGVHVLGIGWGCERGWLVRPLFRHRNDTSALSKLFESSLFARFFTAGSRLVLLEMRQQPRNRLLLTKAW